MLKREDLIEYSRGVIHIPDVKRLEIKACECYQVIKDHLDSYAEFESGIAANSSRGNDGTVQNVGR